MSKKTKFPRALTAFVLYCEPEYKARMKELIS